MEAISGIFIEDSQKFLSIVSLLNLIELTLLENEVEEELFLESYHLIKNILIIVLGYFVWLAYFDEAHSANQENQYCDIKTTLVKTVDINGKTISEESKEIVECDDGVKHFLQDAGIAKECKYYNWTGIEGYTPIEYRSLACEKLDGGYEIIPNYTGIE